MAVKPPVSPTEKEQLEIEILRLKDLISTRRSKLTSLYDSLVTTERSKERCIFIKAECLRTLREIQAAPLVKIKVWKETKDLYEKNVSLITKYSNELVSRQNEANKMEKDVDNLLSMIRALEKVNEQLGVVVPFQKP